MNSNWDSTKNQRGLILPGSFPRPRGTDLGFGSAFNRLVSSARGSCSWRVDETVYLSVLFSRRRSFGGSARGSCSRALMRPFVSLSCSREDDRLVGKRLLRVLKTPEENATNILPELFPWELPLPWAPSTVLTDTAVCPERGDLAHGLAFAKDADASTSHDAGTSATARTRNACGKSAAGKMLAARLNAVGTATSRHSMPRPKRSAVSATRPRPRSLSRRPTPRYWPRVTDGHAVDGGHRRLGLLVGIPRPYAQPPNGSARAAVGPSA